MVLQIQMVTSRCGAIDIFPKGPSVCEEATYKWVVTAREVPARTNLQTID